MHSRVTRIVTAHPERLRLVEEAVGPLRVAHHALEIDDGVERTDAASTPAPCQQKLGEHRASRGKQQ